jgi:hypothetical protein
MHLFARILIAIAFCSTGMFAQGVTAPWDLKKTLESLQASGNRLKPVIEQLNPKDWLAQGAPDGYEAQKKEVLKQLQAVTSVAGRLASDTEKLTLALDLFMRIDSFDLNLQSLAEGVRNYHNPAVAELIVGMRNENGHARQTLRNYVVELAETKEQEFKIVDQEAQKCRSQNMRRRK